MMILPIEIINDILCFAINTKTYCDLLVLNSKIYEYFHKYCFRILAKLLYDSKFLSKIHNFKVSFIYIAIRRIDPHFLIKFSNILPTIRKYGPFDNRPRDIMAFSPELISYDILTDETLNTNIIYEIENIIINDHLINNVYHQKYKNMENILNKYVNTIHRFVNVFDKRIGYYPSMIDISNLQNEYRHSMFYKFLVDIEEFILKIYKTKIKKIIIINRIKRKEHERMVFVNIILFNFDNSYTISKYIYNLAELLNTLGINSIKIEYLNCMQDYDDEIIPAFQIIKSKKYTQSTQ